MASNSSHHITHRMVPLICQALTASPADEQVWIEGLGLLADTKLKTAMSITTSIWLPLLLRGLDPAGSRTVVLLALKLLVEVAEILEPIKTCAVKPLRALARDERIYDSDELAVAVAKLGLTILDMHDRPIVRPRTASIGGSVPNTPRPESAAAPSQHPILADMLARSLPAVRQTVQQAWTRTLMTSPSDNTTLWLPNLYQATLEACDTPEMLITARLGTQVHAEMFHTAFFKCYRLIEEDVAFKGRVHETLIELFNDRNVSQDISIALLELLAFLHKERAEVLDEIYDAAIRCAVEELASDYELGQPIHPVAVWYAEQAAIRNPSPEALSTLVEVNIRAGPIGGLDAAWSSLLWLQDDFQQEPDPMWITHLGHWKDALAQQDKEDGGGPVSTFGSFNVRMVCYHAMGEFQRGYQLAQSLFDGLNDHERRKTSHWAAAAAWHMGDYDAMADYISFHTRGTSKSLYKAIIDVNSGNYASAFHHIEKAQCLAYDELQSQMDSGPQVALKSLAKTEYLVELQEAIQYKSQPDLQKHILSNWRARWKRSHADANSWLRRLRVWSLASPPTTPELQACWLNCAKLCEGLGMHEAAEKCLNEATPTVHTPGCKVEYTRFRFLWKDAYTRKDTSAMQDIVLKLNDHLDEFVDSIKIDRGSLESEGLGLRPLTTVDHLVYWQRNALARRFYRLAQWLETLQGPEWVSDPENQVYTYYSCVYKLDDTWFNGSYAMATAAMSLFEMNGYSRCDAVAVSSYIVPAVRGLFQAVRARETPEKMIKALLRLVTLWFRYGESNAVLIEVEAQLVHTDISCWLMAIPQLIARLGTPHAALQGVLVGLLKNLASASHFPHAVIWPLLTASQTKRKENEDAARVIMDYICSMPDGSRLVSQAELVGRELIRTSISWMEKWRNIIDKSLPRTDLMEIAWHDIPAAWHDEIAKLSSPETPDEDQFVQQFGDSLQHIYQTLLRYRQTRHLGLVNTAYTELYKLYGSIDGQLDQWRMPGSKLHLATAAPKLLSIRDCILTVPGQYDPAIKLDDQAFIDNFAPTVDILSSKQLPRKVVIRSHQSNFTFLLKGNEDLRGDERIMQLFNLINTLLVHENEAFQRNLHLLPYEVIPLSPSAGLLSWVPNTMQLQSMIQGNREKDRSNRLSNMELASLLGHDPATFSTHGLDRIAEMDRYEKLPLEVKVERLRGALSHSKQTDLKDVLWQRSPDAEIWVRRRTNFARTIGVGSFVGHIIGLGDRHGSNILVDQLTWGALHIDFGDLFWVAQERTYLPEKVPFRLTRMMINAFEIGACMGSEAPGSRGTFKQASIISMGVLRNNRSTLLAMLEAFLYDPLLSWTSNADPSDANLTTDENKQGAATTTTRKPDRVGSQSLATDAARQVKPVAESVRLPENSLALGYIHKDSYMSRVPGRKLTNQRALQVLARIESKLAGYEGSEQPLSVDEQVQTLIEEATNLENLCQGYILGWIPHF